jgi:transposase InsO family protein
MAEKTIGFIECYEIGTLMADWLDRVEEVFQINKEEDDRQKVAFLLTHLGPAGYEVVKALCAPLRPNTKSFAALAKLLVEHLDPNPTPLAQRYKFYRLNQGKWTVAQWKAQLAQVAIKCEFGEHRDQAIRDQFIFGLANERTRVALMAEDNITLDAAYKKAAAREQATDENRMIHGGTSSVNAVHGHGYGGAKNFRGGDKRFTAKKSSTSTHNQFGNVSGNGKKVCNRCKLPEKTNKCFNNQCKTQCFNCSSIGHTKSVCRKAKVNAVDAEDTEEYPIKYIEIETMKLSKIDNDLCCNKIDNEKPTVCIVVDGQLIDFEFDTGSAITCIPYSLYNSLFTGADLRLTPAKTRIRVANGATIQHVQVCQVNVRFRGARFSGVSLFVASDPFPALLGRDWMTMFWGCDWIRQCTGLPVKQVSSQVAENRAVRKVTEAVSNVAESRAAREVTVKQDVVRQAVVAKTQVRVSKAEIRAAQVDGQDDYVVRFNPSSERAREPEFVRLDTTCHGVGVADAVSRLEKIKQNSIFSPGLGEVVGYEATLQLRSDARPVYRKARSVPYAQKGQIAEKLDQMEQQGILKRVDHSEFASPMIPVAKSDGDIRICGDYKPTLNPNLETKQYPLPTVEECFQPMVGGQKFTKLDIRQAYNNLKLRKCDQLLSTINTCKGLYVWTRLPYGISSSTAIFQQVMDQVLQGLDSTVCRVDDILVTGKDDLTHLTNLEAVVKRLEDAGFRCNLQKTKFMADEVTYLGYMINKGGIRPCQSKVETLLKAKYPSNLQQLISFLSAVNYYGRFIKNLSTRIEPLNRLRRTGVEWQFGKEEQDAFDGLKKALTSSAVVVPYDPSLPVKIDTDASPVGIGAVLSHVYPDGTEKPIEMASRSLSKAERNYAQIEKEALSLVWGIKKFHKYVFARSFTLVTDHKPLLFILKENKGIPEMATSRIVRWAIILSAYQYTIQYRPTDKHANADVCSRFPLESTEDECLPEQSEVADVFFNTFIDKPLINHETISKFTHTDPVLSKVRKFVRSGWPDRLVTGQEVLKPFYEKRHELTVEYGCVLWAARVVVPSKLRADVLDMLHVSHQGMVAVKALARSYVWWPNINEEIENVSRHCKACQDSQRRPDKAKPHPWTPAKAPYERIHVDFCGPVEGKMWLVVVDAYTKWVEIVDMRQCTTSAATIKELRKIFACWGLCRTMVSDNGPQLVSSEMTEFLESNGIHHIPVPKYHPASNGLAENAVRTFKVSMEKAGRVSKDIHLNLARWLMHQRNTPHTTTNQTPAVMMLGRPTRTLLSLLDPLTNSRKRDNVQLTDDTTRVFDTGDKVRVLNCRTGEWYPGTVVGKEGCKVYLVQTSSGLERRHVDHLVAAVDFMDLETRWPEPKTVHKPVIVQGPEHEHAAPVVPSQESPHLSKLLDPVGELEHRAPSKAPYEHALNVPDQSTSSNEPVRRSSRLKSQVQPLSYHKLGGGT